MEDKIQHSKPVPPFVRFCAANIPMVFDDSLSYYECLCALWNWLQTDVINVINNNATVTQKWREELTEFEDDMTDKFDNLNDAFDTLKNWVETYFDNLDVQEEINNKLDQMVEDGTLQEIISAVLSVTYLYDEITTTEYYDDNQNTHYWITHIPHLDKDGNLIAIKHGTAGDVEDSTLTDTETPRDFAKRSGATICVNASIYGVVDTDTNYHHVVGTLIKDGKLVSSYPKQNSYSSLTLLLLGVKEDNELKCYPYDTPAETLLADGVINTFCAFTQLVNNGVIKENLDPNPNPWNLLGQNTTTKDIYLIECNGRNIYNENGMYLRDMCQILVDLGCDFVYQLDGGGSTSINQYGSMLNYPLDGVGTTIRKTCDYLYFGKDPVTEIDKNMKLMNAQRSDDRLEAFLAKRQATYLRNVDNASVTFNYPNNFSASGVEGIRLMYKENDTNRCTLILDSSNLRKGLSIYDNENQKTIAIINPNDGTIRVGDTDTTAYTQIYGTPSGDSVIKVADKSLVFSDGKFKVKDGSDNTDISFDADTNSIKLGDRYLGNFFSTAFGIDDLNDVKNSGLYCIRNTSAHKPFTSASYGILFVIKNATNNIRQFAIPDTNNSTVDDWWTRNYINSTSTWESWRKMTPPTS